MKKVNPEYARAIMEIANRDPYLKLLGMKICELDYGYCRVETQLDTSLNNPFGSLHGGVFSSILDTATFWVLYCCIGENDGITTLDLQVNNLAAINSGTIIVEGRLIRMGRTIGLAEGTLKDENGRLLAQGTSKMFVLPGLQSIDKVVDKAGFATMPPKFI
ncbi:MAG: PaaI family thioesterase [Acidaminococcaceae bacterium]|nr:PaaI family thioesterase [Acidaminococcaceae bacterium]